jgi:hypothetical protein
VDNPGGDSLLATGDAAARRWDRQMKPSITTLSKSEKTPQARSSSNRFMVTSPADVDEQ